MKGFQQRMQLSWVKSFLVLAILIGLGVMQAHAATYYVATNGNNGWAGTSEGTAWRTITYAATRAVAGDTVNIKAGNYGNEHVVQSNNGSSSSRITFQGYGGTVLLGTLPSPRTAPASSEIGFKISGNYVTLRNLNFTWYYECVYVNSADYVILDNIVINKCGSTGAYGDGIFVTWSNHVTIQDCTVTDCGGNNVFLNQSNYCLIDNLNTRGTYSGSDQWATDYYCVMRTCHDNVIQNSVANDTVGSNKGNHGFIIKDLSYTPHSTNNTIQDCQAYNFEECFSVAHLAYGNTFLRCTADNTNKNTTGWNAAFQARNGAYNNTFRECVGTGRHAVASLTNYDEGNATTKSGNKWINCVLKGIDQSNSIGVVFNGTSSNSFENCVFDKVINFARYVNSNSGNSFKNCIIYSIPNAYDSTASSYYPMGNGATPYNGTSALTVTYTDFYANGFSAFSGTGNISSDPKFASTTDYHLKSTGGRWNGSAWVQDTEDSPCIDAGDPASSYANEPEDNGDRINIGAYGNTDEASKTGTGTLPTNMDNRLREADPTGVYGTNTFLDVGYNASNSTKYRDITWFDMTAYMDDDPNTITDAKLSMYWYYPSTTRAADTVVDVMMPESGWDHGYVCWNNKANGTAWTYAGGDWTDYNGTSQGTTPYASVTFPAATVATNQYYNWTVTELVKDIITAGSNPGMFIKAHTEATGNYIAFYGASNTSNRPKLSITRLASQTEGTEAYDNRLKSSTPTTVLGTSTFSDVGILSAVSYRDLIWFDLSPYEDVATVTKATLSLYWYYPSSTRTNNTVVDIYRPAAGWDPAYVCWSNKASGTAWTNAGGDWYDANGTAQGSTPFASYTFPAGTVATNQYYEFDVTALVNYYRTNGGNAGFFIKARTEGDNYIAFYSLNNASYKPKLEITSEIQQ